MEVGGLDSELRWSRMLRVHLVFHHGLSEGEAPGQIRPEMHRMNCSLHEIQGDMEVDGDRSSGGLWHKVPTASMACRPGVLG